MKKMFFLTAVLLISSLLKAQTSDSTNVYYQNMAEKLLSTDGKLVIGGYGEVHLNQELNSEKKNNSTLDVHRMVMLFGYNFDSRTQFVSELEFEHVKEVYVEQAFLQYKLNKSINFRAGLLLVPMGIINEYHEPVAFNGVERPNIDSKIAPTTWREIGFGVAGTILPASLKYQAYLINGFNGYDSSAKLSGANGLRKGRQKGAESYMSSPNFTSKIEYFGLRGLNLGLSTYYGKTQSSLFNGVDKNDKDALAQADSSVVGISMIGFDTRYSFKGIKITAQLYYSSFSNVEQYNTFGSSDLGSSMLGYYFEIGYNVLKSVKDAKKKLIPFIRYETYNTHNSVEGIVIKNHAYENTIITAGFTLNLAKGAVVKTDVQFAKSKADSEFSTIINAGFGVAF